MCYLSIRQQTAHQEQTHAHSSLDLSIRLWRWVSQINAWIELWLAPKPGHADPCAPAAERSELLHKSEEKQKVDAWKNPV